MATLITAKANVQIKMRGVGSCKINWGDGTPPETNLFPLANAELQVNHAYTTKGKHKIEITFDNRITSFNCAGNEITALDVSDLVHIAYLNCRKNSLTQLDVSNNISLVWLYCEYNDLTEIDVSALHSLRMLHTFCNSNLTQITGVSGLTNLTTLRCRSNLLTTLDVTGCTSLEFLDCQYNRTLTQITGLARLAHLRELLCHVNALTALDVTGCISLTTLKCYLNGLTVLTGLTGLACLKELHCSNNQLSSLNVAGCTSLENMQCQCNRLTQLNVSGLTLLRELYTQENHLSGIQLNLLFHSLTAVPAGEEANLFIRGNTGATNVSGCNTAIATNKGWSVDCFFAPHAPAIPSMTLVTAKTEVRMFLKGTGNAVIEWDNNAQSTFRLSPSGIVCENIYKVPMKRTITISGVNITSMNCVGNQAEGLDAGKNPVLEELDCSKNALKKIEGLSLLACLKILRCSDNSLTRLDLAGCPSLVELQCFSNDVTVISGLAGLTQLNEIVCNG